MAILAYTLSLTCSSEKYKFEKIQLMVKMWILLLE